ncbi:tRNA (N6-threonylcarbamoyladenosine(37)-N6)-methyltransferase TrmO [Bowmanella dokdonensis]|nr:tRNA (N6-threonylcarbamoyladenosine(37)-N6)-methyltransferase TrmO [Bowmanella dokdonensis]
MQLSPIGFIRTPYQEKFAIPRQPGLVPSAIGEIHFQAPFDDVNCLRGIEQFSHLWLIFQFHQTLERGWTPLVRPPRLGGNRKLGVFATRSTHRPNGMGLSVVEVAGLTTRQGKPLLKVRGMDLLDGTPILDIKPYLPYADALPEAEAGFADAPPAIMEVVFTEQARRHLQEIRCQSTELEQLISEVLTQDPRPAYKQQNKQEEFGMRISGFNIRWQAEAGVNRVLSIEPAATPAEKG